MSHCLVKMTPFGTIMVTYSYFVMIIMRQFDCHYNSYEVKRSGLFEAININALYDYHPLSIYNNKNRFLLPLKHFISDQA